MLSILNYRNCITLRDIRPLPQGVVQLVVAFLFRRSIAFE